MDNSSQDNSSLGEWIRFGILVVVMVGAVLVVALSRSFVANRVVPAFLTPPDRHTVSLPIMEETGGATTVDPATTDTDSAEENTAGEATTEDGSSAEGASTETENDGAAAEDGEAPASEDAGTEEAPAAESTNTVTHVIQPGESLFVLAQRYNITVDQIVEANNISNPNRIAVGDTLVIPQP